MADKTVSVSLERLKCHGQEDMEKQDSYEGYMERTARPSAPIAQLKPVGFGEKREGLCHVQDFLVRFGYLEERHHERDVLDRATSEALVHFQVFFKLKVTGIFDEDTRDWMTRPRCGLPDPSRVAFKIVRPWRKRTQITFAFNNGTTDISGNVERQAVRNAFRTWQAIIPLDFREVPLNSNPDIVVDWRNANDLDFSMVGSVIAHSDYPPGCSVVVSSLPLPLHFDDSENTWSIGAAAGAFDVESIALHEIGHLIGLDHTTVAGAVIWPSIGANTLLQRLTQDDIDGAQKLYGKRISYQQNTPLAALTRNDDQMDVFAVNQDDGVYSAWWNGNPWRDWFRIGGDNNVFPQHTPIAALSRNDDQMDLFAVGFDGNVYSTWWDGTWHDWFRLPIALAV
jgi:Matrixin/Putative peptidoglycan binding domain